MKSSLSLGVFFCIAVFSSSFGQFAVCVDSGMVTAEALVDASAMASSKVNDSIVWVCNGHSDNNKFYALDTHGKLIATYYLKVKWQRNWEDMASGPGPDPAKSYLYIGDIGDNDAEWATKTVYRFVEPDAHFKGNNVIDTVTAIDKLEFVYPDTIRDAEAMMVDPLTKDYYIISKREDNVRVYRAPYPQPVGAIDTLEFLDSIPYRMITAADISAAGDEILIKDYMKIYYWKREKGETIIQAMKRPTKQKIPYIREPVGEALCWSRTADGYFTTSEEKDSVDCRLYHFLRTPTRQVAMRCACLPDLRIKVAYCKQVFLPGWHDFPAPDNYFDIAGRTARMKSHGAMMLIRSKK
jgi:hypothetical protein